MTGYARLDGKTISVVFTMGSGPPEVLYLGKRLPNKIDLGELERQLARPWPHGTLDQPVALTLLPETGRGFFGMPGIRLARKGQELNTQLILTETKPVQDGFEFLLEDEFAGIGVAIEVRLPPERDSLSILTRVRNTGEAGLEIIWLASVAWCVPAHCNQVISFGGRWANEFRESRHVLKHGALVFENQRGRTSHSTFPALVFGSPGLSNRQGEVISASILWSGNHRCLAEKLPEGPIQMQLGERLSGGELVLKRGESFAAAPAVLTYSERGLNPLRHAYHEFVRSSPLYTAERSPRPVHFNTWEACYFDHSERRILELVSEAAALGAERFVLDDGWMQDRTSDSRGLGNWRACSQRYPNGLEPVIMAVESAGMEFGLWIEPEMVNEDSDLFRSHPDWILRDGSRVQPVGRNQYALALYREDVFDHVLNSVLRLVERYRPAYLKWDMNRDLVHCVDSRRPAYHRMTAAFYRLVEKLREKAPGLELEICASGGGRADLGAALAADRIWVSDTHDPHDRQIIHKNISLFLPPEKMGCHIGQGRSAVSGRQHSLRFRGLTALQGHLGLELDPGSLSGEDRTQLRQIIDLFKKHRSWIFSGQTCYLDHPDPGLIAQTRVSQNRRQAFLFGAQIETPTDAVPAVLRLDGLDPNQAYDITLLNPDDFLFMKASSPFHRGSTIRGQGETLMSAGLQLPYLQAESCALVLLEAA